MAADEKPGRIFPQLLDYRRIVARGVAADVGHQHANPFRLPAKFIREIIADIRAVDVSMDAAQGTKAGQPAGEVGGAEVAGVPYLVTLFEVAENGVIEEVMCIG